MDRTEFFKLAQQVAIYTNKCKDLSKPLLENCLVIYKNVIYYPQGVYVGYDESGNVENIARLHDLRANAITDCRLENVKKYV